MRRFRVLLALILCFIAPTAASTEPFDAIDEALATVGLTRDDLGYRPKGYWSRFPDPHAIDHKLPAFDDLFAEPLRTYDYTRSMANAGAKYLDPKFGSNENERASERLYLLLYSLGVDRFVGGFRSYSPNLTAVAPADEPLKTAIAAMYAYRGRDLAPMSFGQQAAWPAPGSTEAQQLEAIPLELQQILARAIFNLLDAAKWRDLSLRKCDADDLAAIYAIRDLGSTQGDGQVFYPAIADVAETIDWQSMAYAWLKASATAGLLREEAAMWVDSHPEAKLGRHFCVFDTPLGAIVLGDSEDASFRDLLELPEGVALALDLGGDDAYRMPIGSATSAEVPVSIAVDLEGEEVYGGDSPNVRGYGAGVLGVGVLWDADGDDTYLADHLGLGFGQLGCGLLFDEGEEDDHFTSVSSAQGCGYLGIGMCISGGGDDEYQLAGGEGQGFGGIGGIGICLDYAGEDTYYAEPVATEGSPRADYHSDFDINVSNAQGVGAGRRGDGSDGHAWAGGLGALIDLEGDDRYTSGNWSLGTGYWFGMGFLWDNAGDDRYESVYFTQGSGAHFCIGGLFDEGDGNDTHLLQHTAGAALGFGWDFTDAIFLDAGGDDRYSAKLISFGCAEIRSNAFFFELGGNDTYTYTPGLLGFGAVDWRDDYAVPGPVSTYFADVASVGLFLDFGGTDTYTAHEGRTPQADAPMANDASWLTPEAESPRFGYRNFGIGVDREGGVWRDRDRWFAAPPVEP